MADNNYKQGNKVSAFLERSNGLANASNVVKMKVEQQYCDKTYLVGGFVVTGAGTQLEFTASGVTAGYNFRFINVTVFDQSGNDASATASGTSAVVTVDTSGLDANDMWTVKVRMSTEADFSIECACANHYEVLVNDPYNNPTVTVDEVTIAQPQVITVYQANGTTVIADGGAAYNIGTFAASGTTEAFTLKVKNTGEGVLQLTTPLGVTADVLTATIGAFDNYLYAGDVITVSGTVDASGGAGSYTGAVTIASNDPSNASYVVNIAYDLV